jgi:hypothetical protein
MAIIRRLITAAQLIDNVPISATADQELLKKVIYNEQETKIHNLLGSKLYRALLQEATDNVITGKRKECIDEYIRPALYQYAYRAAVLHLNLRVTDKGVMVQSDDNAAQANESQVHHLRADIKNKADFYAELAIRFICENSGDFPEYCSNDTDNGGVISRKSGYFSGIQLK